MIIVFSIFQTHQAYAQDNKKQKSKIKFRHLAGLYNHEAQNQLKTHLSVKERLYYFHIYSRKRLIADSLHSEIVQSSPSTTVYINFPDGISWELPMVPRYPRYPSLMERSKEKGYDVANDEDFILWVHYMYILDYWKKYKKLPAEKIKSYSSMDTIQLENADRLIFKHLCTLNGGEVRNCNESLIPLD